MEAQDRPLGQQRRSAPLPRSDGDGAAAQGIGQATASAGQSDGPRRALSTALSVGGLAALALGGWLEEVARLQAIEKYYGLPLTMAGDPRAAAAFAGLPLAVGVAVNAALVVAVVLTARRHPWAGASFVVVAVAGVLPPQSWSAGLTRAVVMLAALAVLYRLRAKIGRVLARAAVRLADRSARAEAPYWDVELGTPVVGLGAAVAVAALLFAPLHLGDQTGRRQAADRDVFFVVAAYACEPGVAVVALRRDGDFRTARVADRRVNGRWQLRPGLFSVPVDETLLEVRMGGLARSRPSSFPPPRTILPRRCPSPAGGP